MKTPLECSQYFRQREDLEWITSGNDTQYLIDYDSVSGEVTVVFDKSNSLTDWLNNFKFWKKPYKNMGTTFFCHSGFLTCFKLVEDEIREAVKALNPKSITITGWSYGGAMATLCMENFWYEFIYLRENPNSSDSRAQEEGVESMPSLRGKIQCITFGAPRVFGWWNFKKIKERFDGTRMFKNSADLVTCVPLVSMLYKHVVKRIHIGDKIHFWNYLFKVSNYHNFGTSKGYDAVLDEICTSDE